MIVLILCFFHNIVWALFDRKTFLRGDMLKLCMKQKCDIAESFLNTTVFINKKNSRYEVME